MKAALMSPSGHRFNPWEFVLVEDKEVLKALSQAKAQGAALIEGAAMAIAVIGDTTKTDVWVEDCSIAMTIMQLEAETLGLGSCWIQIRNRMAQGEEQMSSAFIKDLLHIPEPYEVLAVLALGVPDEEKPGRTLEALQYAKVHNEVF